MKKIIALLVLTTITFSGFAQDDTEETSKSNIQEYTPSKLLKKGQWDIKFFNSIYTQTESTNERSKSVTIPRQTFFTNTTEVYTGVSNNSRINVGLIFQVRSNTFGGAGALDVFKFEDNANARFGLTTIAPSIRVQPFASVPNFSFTSSVYLPIFKDKANAPYLDKRSVFWETKFFYDKTFGSNKWQVFTEADLGFNFGKKRVNENNIDISSLDFNNGERFANNSLFVPLSVFLSYFPSSKTTVFANTKQAFLIDLGNDFSQNSTSLGFGGKYQLTDVLNVEASFDKFVRGNNFQGLGQTFSLGLRALF
ncbi:hypothetical protein [Ichthyenterobacterium magnum]|uniref:Outer membrane beta-barrel porin/alpha-amylase n=1 Tax=Ichthyenterobacterium magnum TaxID=1230530 RepID=A0A420DW12_9FLAO|nr:hypothetical protein [Ichthyenterobacterium magnum]RKE98414.1 hypothetical protein BXY80_0500 [Ichthyenterobacterium magnum]